MICLIRACAAWRAQRPLAGRCSVGARRGRLGGGGAQRRKQAWRATRVAGQASLGASGRLAEIGGRRSRAADPLISFPLSTVPASTAARRPATPHSFPNPYAPPPAYLEARLSHSLMRGAGQAQGANFFLTPQSESSRPAIERGLRCSPATRRQFRPAPPSLRGGSGRWHGPSKLARVEIGDTWAGASQFLVRVTSRAARFWPGPQTNHKSSSTKIVFRHAPPPGGGGGARAFQLNGHSWPGGGLHESDRRHCSHGPRELESRALGPHPHDPPARSARVDARAIAGRRPAARPSQQPSIYSLVGPARRRAA